VNAIVSSNIYKHPEDYIYGRDTFYVESFNNVINVYQNKRIVFDDEQYNTRNNLAVCHWNKNVDREHTSVSNPQNARRPRSKRGKKTIRNSHSNLEIIFGNVLSIVCLEKETKGGTIKLFYLIMKADEYIQFYKLFPFRILQYSLIYLLKC
jgi:hypothetical protein